VANNAALREPGNLILPPLVGFGVTFLAIRAGLLVAKSIGLQVGTGLRTFGLAVGLANYGYLPLPIMTALWGVESRGVLLVHNVGVEAAIWTVGILVLSGVSLRDGWRRLFNAPVFALILAVALNVSGAGAWLPTVVKTAVAMCGASAVPLGLLVIGATLMEYFGAPRTLVDRKVTPLACALRLGVLPVLMLALAALLPLPREVKQVLIVQAAMPAGILPIVIAKHYGGQPLTAVQVVLGTTAAGLLVVPLWLQAGLHWVAP